MSVALARLVMDGCSFGHVLTVCVAIEVVWATGCCGVGCRLVSLSSNSPAGRFRCWVPVLKADPGWLRKDVDVFRASDGSWGGCSIGGALTLFWRMNLSAKSDIAAILMPKWYLALSTID